MRDVGDADWLKVAQLDSLEEIKLFAQWVHRLGSGERDLGEASVFAAAEIARAMYDNLNRFFVPNAAGPARMVPLTALADEEFTLIALRRSTQPAGSTP